MIHDLEMRSLVTRTADWILTGLGADELARRWKNGGAVVLAYHNIVPHGESPSGDSSLHLPQSIFGRQLDVLSQTHDVVGLSELLSTDADELHGSNGLRAAITFDDAYSGALTAGVEELARRDLPATFFVSPYLLGRRAFWWDLLASDETGSVDDAVRDHALEELSGRQSEIIRWAEKEGILRKRSLPVHARSGTLSSVRSLADAGHISLASHGWQHLNLAAVNRNVLTEELTEPVEWFQELGLAFEPWLAFPYGRFSPEAVKEARSIYARAFTVEGAMLESGQASLPDRWQVPRINIPAGIRLNRFRLLTSGLR